MVNGFKSLKDYLSQINTLLERRQVREECVGIYNERKQTIHIRPSHLNWEQWFFRYSIAEIKRKRDGSIYVRSYNHQIIPESLLKSIINS